MQALSLACREILEGFLKLMYLNLLVLFSLAFRGLRQFGVTACRRGVIRRRQCRRRRHDQPTPDDAHDHLAGTLPPTPLT